MYRTVPTILAPVVAITLVASACGLGGSGDADLGSAPGEEITIIPTEMTDADDIAEADDMAENPVEAQPEESAAADTVVTTAVNADLRQRCIDGIIVLERRWDEEGFEYPDEGPELSEEELEQTMAPAQPFEDGVAAPGERPTLTAMGDFDAETMPIPQLDRFRESCFEQGLVTDADVYGEEDFDEGEVDEWCAELAAFPIDEVREFAAEEGEDVVAEEFAECGLPNPLAP